jgi:hypothetical protein
LAAPSRIVDPVTKVDTDVFSTAEFYSDLCNIVERNYQRMPLPGELGDDGLGHTSDDARRAANAILAAIFHAAGLERPVPDPMEYVKGAHPGHTDEWYVAMLARMQHYAADLPMDTAPKLPPE